MGIYEAVKNRILNLCGEKKLTLHELSTRSGVSPSTLKNILYGRSVNPGIVTIKLLCDGLGVSVVTFFDAPEFRTLDQEMK